MERTIAIIIIFFVSLLLLALIFALFLQPATVETTKIRYGQCVVMQNKTTGAIDCYGCVADKCKDATDDWVLYQQVSSATTYTCVEATDGCQLVK